MMHRIFSWSVSNQIESDAHRTLPSDSDMSSLGRFICRCWFDIGGGSISNGIGKLIVSFACGFNDSKSPFALQNMPREGKVADNRTRCFNCTQPIVDPTKPLRCCGKVVYCSANCNKLNWRIHKPSCLRKK